MHEVDDAPIHTKSSERGDSVVVTHLPTEQKDVDTLYEEFLLYLPMKEKEGVAPRDSKLLQEDFFRLFRTRVVLCWMLSNVLLM